MGTKLGTVAADSGMGLSCPAWREADRGDTSEGCELLPIVFNFLFFFGDPANSSSF